MKLKLDLSKCIGCGTCQSICPDHFKLGEDMKAHLDKGGQTDLGEEKEITEVGCAEEAADSCAVQAIELEK